MTRLVTLTLEEAAELNAADPPKRGVQVGGGIHVQIPDDWEARILAGEHVSGCTYYEHGREIPVDEALALSVSPALATKITTAALEEA